VPIADGKVLAVRPSQGTFGVPHAQIAAPGDPYRSMIYLRMAKLGAGHMPHLGSSIIDRAGLELIHDWIKHLPRQPDNPPPLERPAALDLLAGAPNKLSAAERGRVIDELLSTPSQAAMLARAVRKRAIADEFRPMVVAAATKHADAAVRDLFEPFVPEEQRAKRLGDLVRADEILKIAGDIPRGRLLFHKTAGVQCKNCHHIAGDGTELGPDLSQIGKKLDRAKLFESILDPSKNIDPQFLTWVVETKSGKVVSGLLVRKDASETVLKDAQNQIHRLATDDIESSTPLQKSLMPELLVRDFTAQQVADLLAYLESLK
jgi:putative heme-binding domain-containing protein